MSPRPAAPGDRWGAMDPGARGQEVEQCVIGKENELIFNEALQNQLCHFYPQRKLLW